MPAPAEVVKLVEKFARNREEYESGSYNETQARRDFIDPLLKALGWDVDNSRGASERYREVVHEDKVRIGGETKAPDYSCRLGGNRVFFVEAKKPGVDLKTRPEPAFQLRRYAWSAKLPVSVLTDFDELAIYDTTLRPNLKDAATVGRLRYWTSSEFVEKWDEIAGILSRDAVESGAFDRFAAERKRKRTQPVDEDFLEAIEGWRELLAKDIAKENPKIGVEDLNFSVQRILDRIIFLRICEDRRIEQVGRLGALANVTGVYGHLKQLFDFADQRYNSGLFHFRQEKDRHESPDTVTPKLKVSDQALKKIIGALYDDAPWAFDVIPSDILGSIYERFLGKTIRLTPAHLVKVEEKPEVRKAGGVYYTPKYIVDYIVQETVGKLLQGKTPKQAAEIKVLDPACGSGSFLIGAYQYLLDWHLEQYLKAPEKHKKQLKQVREGEWRLATSERKRILINSIFGVDLDPQAVEVTKLSLLLKVLEGETGESIQLAMELSHERALPDLGDNVRCGNSLYDNTMILEGGGLFGAEGGAVVRPFDWRQQFSGIFGGRSGGFHAVIGNPPYSLVDNDQLKDLASQAYRVAEGRIDTFELFIERGVGLLGVAGTLGFIVPSPVLTNVYARKLRDLLMSETQVLAIANMAMPVFEDPTVHTCILVCQKTGSSKSPHRVRVWKAVTDARQLDGPSDYTVLADELARGPSRSFDVFVDPAAARIVNALERGRATLGDLCFIRQTIKTGDDSKYVMNAKKDPGAPWKRALRGSSVDRYVIKEQDLFLKYGNWLARNWQNPGFFETPKIVIRETGRRLVATYDDREHYLLSSLYSVYPKASAPRLDLKVLLAVLNSSLATYYLRLIALGVTEGAFTKFRTNQLARLPVWSAADADRAPNALRELRGLADRMLSLGAARTPDAPSAMEAIDVEIDRLVCDLYDIPPDARSGILGVM